MATTRRPPLDAHGRWSTPAFATLVAPLAAIFAPVTTLFAAILATFFTPIFAAVASITPAIGFDRRTGQHHQQHCS
ncbi:MAG: hypothetical protein M4D80_20790 [Myxococcota bacterium]|nr:hypothetical protein [Myxococcota bacterium]